MTSRLQDRAFIAAVAAMAVVCALALIHITVLVPLHIPLDPNEGWNAYHAEAAMTHGALYPRAPSLMVNNYPPLFFYLDGAFGRLVGDNIVAGRILSLVACLAMAYVVVLVVKRRGGWPEAAFAALFLIAALLLHSDYVGMSDPQLFGHAIQLTALLILLSRPRGTVSIGAAALLLVIGFFFKHNLIALPLALTLWLALIDRSNAIKLAVFGLSFGALGLLAFRLSFGISLLAQLQSPRIYSFGLLAEGLGSWLAWNGAPLIAAFLVLVPMRRDPIILLCLIYLALSGATGAVLYGGAGVDTNTMFDAFIALSLAAGFALTRWQGARRTFVASLWALPLIMGFTAEFDGNWLTAGYWLEPMSLERRAAAADIAFLQTRVGPTICEMLSLCYWAGKAAEADVFNLGQQYATGRRNDEQLVQLLEHKHYAVIQIDPDGSFALTPRIESTFKANYRLDHSNEEDGAFYVPR